MAGKRVGPEDRPHKKEPEMTTPIITLAEAKAKGLIHYFTGKPCRQGHIAHRIVSSRTCSMCQRMRIQEREALFPHKYIEGTIRRRHPHALVHLSPDSQKRLEAVYRFAAALRKRTGKDWHVDHCYPLARGGVHHPDNLMILPASLNLKKKSSFDSADPAQVRGLVVSMLHFASTRPSADVIRRHLDD